jgi:hypothetical protein
LNDYGGGIHRLPNSNRGDCSTTPPTRLNSSVSNWTSSEQRPKADTMGPDPVSWIDFAAAVFVVAMVVAMLWLVGSRWPADIVEPRHISQRSMRNLCQRLEREQADDPDRQS